MAKVTYIEISPEQESLYFSGLQMSDRFNFGKIAFKNTTVSRKRVQSLTERSLLPQVAALWNALSDDDQTAWKLAGQQCGLSAYRLFVQDTCQRLQNGLAGVSTPSLFFQSKVGHIKIQSPATLISIIQMHPSSYWVLKKVVGSKSMYEPVVVTENFVLPLQIQLNYKSNLTAVGPSPSAKFYAKIWYRYQAIDKYYNLEIPLDLVSSWCQSVASSVAPVGQIVGYDLYFTLQDVQGDLYFDNLKSIHTAQNWVRDSYCNDINQTFTKVFYQIPKAWAAVEIPVGASYGSVPSCLL